VPKPWYFPFQVCAWKLKLMKYKYMMWILSCLTCLVLWLLKFVSVYAFFIFQLSYWYENSNYKPHFDTDGKRNGVNNSDVYEAEPSNLPAGIQIKHLRKVVQKLCMSFRFDDTRSWISSA
jgi:hypothetical protein